MLPLTDLDPVVLAEAAAAIRDAGAAGVPAVRRGRPRLPGQVGVPRHAHRARAAVAAHLAAGRRGPGRAALPGAAEAAARVRRPPHLPLRVAARSWPSSARYSPVESVVQQAPPGPRVQHRLLRRPRRAGARRRAAGDDPEQGRRADQGRDARRPAARGARRRDGGGPRPGRAQHGAVLPRGRPHPGDHRHQHALRRRVPAAAGRRRRLRRDDHRDRRRRAARAAARRHTARGS